jgi:hypothetical protein
MRAARTVLVVVVLGFVAAALSGCGSTVSALCATKVNIDGSGSRTLTLMVAKRDVAGEKVDMKTVLKKLNAARPPFSKFTDDSTASTYKFVISYDFKDPADFESKARWFGATSSLEQTGGILTPAVGLSESFKSENWFQWAIQSSGRESGDIKDVQYSVEMPAAVQDESQDGSDGVISGGSFAKTDLSFSSSYDFKLVARRSFGVDSMSVATVVRPDGTAERALTYSLSSSATIDLVKSKGGPDGLQRAFASWAGNGWSAKIGSAGTTSTAITLTKSADSVSGLTAGERQSGAPALDMLSTSNAYVSNRRYAEVFSPSSLIPGEISPSTVAYSLSLPWTVESHEPRMLQRGSTGALTWSGATMDDLDVKVTSVEMKDDVLYPVLSVLAALILMAITAGSIGILRILTSSVQ